MFIVGWNCRKLLDNDYLLFLGIAYFFVAMTDLFHMLSYKGMGVFPGNDANVPTQFWIVARYMESLSLLIAPFFLKKRLRISAIFTVYGLVFVILTAPIFSGWFFPDCFVEGAGLTPFKKISEYIICIILIWALVFLMKNREVFSSRILHLLAAAVILTILAELAFTFYISVYGFSNLIGHFIKIISFYLIYRAIIVTGLMHPFDLLFRNLKENEKKLSDVNRDLTLEIAERQKAEEKKDALIGQLQDALREIKTLRGIIPICSSCKKIRDDQGYWSRLEQYIKERSDAEFTHRICPECAEKIYDIKLDE
ncbi:MAG: MASE3 domain-containing protein [Pseudomonadota bacterium]